MAGSSSDLLDSTSYLIPVEEDGEETLMADIIAMTDADATLRSTLPLAVKRAGETCGEEDSLASTLTQAYGFSTTPDFLSSLASPRREKFESMEEDLGGLSSVQASSLPPSTVPESTMSSCEAATVIQTAW